jgi:hypothetical protein
MAGNDDRIPLSVQQSIATAIAFSDDDNTRYVASTVDINLLDAPLDDIVARCLEYRKKYQQAPGAHHIDEVLASILEDKGNSNYESYSRTLNAMLRLSDKLNTDFVRDNVVEFNHRRYLRAQIARASEVYTASKPNTIAEIKGLFRETLRELQQHDKSKGFRLSSPEALGFLDRSEFEYCPLGIKELDDFSIVPTRKELYIFMAARNRGKSQFLGHVGKMAAIKGKPWKVAHYTLENSAEMTAQRYMQSFYSGVKREGEYYVTEFATKNKSTSIHTRRVDPLFIISKPQEARKYLERARELEPRVSNIAIRSFPSGRFSLDDLEQDLDELETLERFYPDIVLLDSPQLMKPPSGSAPGHEKLERLVTDIRGVGVERNMAMVATQQGNRAAGQAATVMEHHTAGSIGVINVADNAITYSQTASEEEHGLARIYTQKVRNDVARFYLLITQHYPTGQFCLDSKLMTNELRDKVKAFADLKPDEEKELDEDEDEYQRKGKARA